MSGVLIAIIGISFMFLMSLLGGALVFIFKKSLSGRANGILLGFASGIMIASSVWSLLLPAIEQSSNLGKLNFIPAAVGMILGTLFLVLMDKLVPKCINNNTSSNEFAKTSKLFLAVTIHNIPEGLAAGLALGNAFVSGGVTGYSALWFVIGIGIQNFPETSAISFPLKEKFNSNKKAFLYSLASSIVEPIMAVVGIFISSTLTGIMPWLLSFAAGSMLFVVAEEMLPEAKSSHKSSVAGLGMIIGFVVMMILDIVFG